MKGVISSSEACPSGSKQPLHERTMGVESKRPDDFRQWLALVAAVGLLSYLPWLGSFGPLDPTDSFFLESGREMVETGKYLLPLNNYQPWLDKPVLFFWLVAGAYKLGGVTPFVGRLPAALSAVATAVVMLHALRGVVANRTAALAALIFLALPLSSVVGHVCLTDMTLTLCVCATILYLLRGLHEQSSKYLACGYLFNGLGLLCKGPIAAIISGAVIFVYLALSMRSAKSVLFALRSMQPLTGVLIALAVNLPWYAAATAATDGKFFEVFFLQQNFGRMMGTVNHQMPWWFYVPVFIGGFFPWSLSLFLSPKFYFAALKAKSDKFDVLKLALCWFGFVFIMFSGIKTKLPTYILPAAPAFALMIAAQTDWIVERRQVSLIAIPAAAVLLAGVAAFCLQSIMPVYMCDMFSRNSLLMIPVLMAAGAALWLAMKGRLQPAAATVCLCVTAACCIFVPKGLQAFYTYRQTGFNQLICLSRDAKATVAILSAEEPTMPYILHKPVFRLQSGAAAAEFLRCGTSPRHLLVPAEMLARLDWFPGPNRLIAVRGKWHLYEVCAEAKPQLDLIP